MGFCASAIAASSICCSSPSGSTLGPVSAVSAAFTVPCAVPAVLSAVWRSRSMAPKSLAFSSFPVRFPDSARWDLPAVTICIMLSTA